MSLEWQYISSRSNPLIVRLAKLRDKKYRRREGSLRFDGIKLFCEAAKKGADIRYVVLGDSAFESLSGMVEESLGSRHGVSAIRVSDDVFAKLTDEQAPEGIITVCGELGNISCGDADDVVGGRVLMLESVRDVGNMGTIIRGAVAFGVDTLVISSDCADLYNPKTIRAAMGALFKQRILIVESVPDTVRRMRERGYRVFAAALERDARTLGSFELHAGDAILIGNEGHGLSPDAISACDECVYIPMEQEAESLNAGIAASLCMWELYKIK